MGTPLEFWVSIPTTSNSILAPRSRSSKPGVPGSGEDALAPSLDSGLGATTPGGLLK